MHTCRPTCLLDRSLEIKPKTELNESMDKSDYVCLLKESSINDETKFAPVSLERPKTRGRPPKIYHPLLKKEKEVSSAVQRILPKSTPDSVVQKGSRLAHLYGLPKTHKKKLAMRPILSVTGTYNYKLAKWRDEKLKPLSVNEHTASDIFVFADELRQCPVCISVSSTVQITVSRGTLTFLWWMKNKQS